MKNFNTLALFIAFSLAVGVDAATPRNAVRFQASANDVIPTQLISSKAIVAPGTHRETAAVQMSWALPADSVLTAQQPFVRESREYWTTVNARTLAAGATIQTTSAGAVIRLSPVGQTRAVLLDPFSVEVRAQGQTYTRGAAFANAANVAELNASGASFSDGTVAFKLKPEVGSGAIVVALPNAQQDYLLHVFEPDSSEMLSLTTDRLIALHGSNLRVIARMNSGAAVDAIAGSIVSPTGQQTELTFKRQSDGSYAADLRHDGVRGAGAGLWEIHTFASSKNGKVQRDARTAIASAAPRARLAGVGSSAQDRDGSLRVTLVTEVAASGRYEARGTLFGIDSRTGVLRPAAMAHVAAVLGTGAQSLELVYDVTTMQAAGVRAPFEVRELTLIDQAEQSVIELRSAGLKL
jgi:Domain of unknown function (DUF4785)